MIWPKIRSLDTFLSPEIVIASIQQKYELKLDCDFNKLQI